MPKAIVKTPSLLSITKLIERVNDRAPYKDSTVTNLTDRLTNVTLEELFEKSIVHHRDCYSEIANVEKFERAKQRYSDSVEYGDSSVVKRKAGQRSMSSFPNVQKDTLTNRSTSSFFDKTLCIICQCPSGILNRVEFKATGHNMLDVSSKPSGKTLFRRLNSIPIDQWQRML